MLAPGVGGVTVWRFELAPESTGNAPLLAVGIRSQLKLAARLDTLRAGELLMRGDSGAVHRVLCVRRPAKARSEVFLA